MRLKVNTNILKVLFFIVLHSSFSELYAQKSFDFEGLSYIDEKPIFISVVDGKISGLSTKSKLKSSKKIYIAPGLFDIQINGYMGVDFSDQQLNHEKMQKATYALWKEGVTSFLPTVITSDKARLERSFSLLGQFLKDQEIGMSIPGFHLEGPYISPIQGFRGVHSEKYIRAPDWVEFQKFQENAQNGIKLITLAPENEGAISFIEKGVKSGVVISLGHHNGNASQIEKSVEAGAKLSTHLGNGCANEINRHNNPIWPQLSNDGLSISIIADGAHLNKEEIRTFYKSKGPNKTILVSDALALAGLPPGEYLSNDGQKLLLTPEVVKYPAQNVLAGAATPISKCVGNIMKFTGCNLHEAIQMASTNPAKLIGLDDIGELKKGKRADLILFTLESGQMVIQKTIVAGKIVYSKD